MKKLGEYWRLVLGMLAVMAGLGWLLLYRLGSLTRGISTDELQQQAAAGSWHTLVGNPLYVPLSGPEWLMLKLFGHHNTFMFRLPSVLFGLLTIAAFTYVLRRWYGWRITAFGTILFATASWYLQVSRHASPDILYLFAVPALLVIHLLWERLLNRVWVIYLLIAALALLLYIPGLIWLELAGLLLQPHHLGNTWRRLQRWWQRAAAFLLGAGLLLPLAAALVQHTSLAKIWLGLPANFSDPAQIPRRLVQTLSFFVWRGPLEPQLWLDRLPILTIFTTIMALLGAFFYLKHLSAPRSRLLLGLLVVGAVFYALGGAMRFSVLVPIVYLVIACGVGYLLHDWLRVFPRNPLARIAGYGLLSLAVVLSCTLSLRSYFVAWPHNPATVQAFRANR